MYGLQIRWEPNNQWAVVCKHPTQEDQCEAYFCKEDLMDLAGSRGDANFIKKWQGEPAQSYLKMIDVKNVTGATQANHAFFLKVLLVTLIPYTPRHYNSLTFFSGR